MKNKVTRSYTKEKVMSRLNTMYPDDEFLKNISDMMGKLDNKNETEIKQEIEQIGYKEFYRYSKEKDVYIKQLQQENEQLKERIAYLERSNNRREDTILEQRQEISDLEDNWNKLKEYIRKNIIYDDVGMKILDPSSLEDYIQELEQGSDNE